MVAVATANKSQPVDAYTERIEYFLDVRGYAPRPLDNDEMREIYPGFAFGWSIVLPVLNGTRKIDVLLRPDYPYEPAALSVRQVDAWPTAHVVGGMLCVRAPGEPHQLFPDERILARDLDRCAALFTLDRKTADDDRAAEFVNYWKATDVNPPVYSLIVEDTKYGELVAWYGRQFTLIAPDTKSARAWLAARFVSTEHFDLGPALYVTGDALDVTLSKASRVLELASEMHDSEVTAAFESVAVANRARTTIVFRLPGDFALVAGSVCRPTTSRAIVRRSSHPGFRPGHEPPRMAARRYYSTQGFEHDRLERVDAAWLLARGGEGFNPELHARHVIVVGVGSLGSGVARGLIKAGIGRLTLLDPELLRWENVARHELGGTQVGQSKAFAVRDDLLRDFPFAIVDAYPSSWQDAHRKNEDLFVDADLVVATTGDWPSECHLNDLLRAQRGITMVFAWTEAWAAASHVLVVKSDGGCLACGMNAAGDFNNRVVDWPTSQLVRAPACGQTYVPYGEASAMRARAAVLDEVLRALTADAKHSTLFTELNDERLYTANGGTIRESFLARLGRVPDALGARTRSPCLRQATCPVCERSSMGA